MRISGINCRGEGDRRELHFPAGGPGPEGRRADPIEHRAEEGVELDEKHPVAVRTISGAQPDRVESGPGLFHGHRAYKDGEHLQPDHPGLESQPFCQPVRQPGPPQEQKPNQPPPEPGPDQDHRQPAEPPVRNDPGKNGN